MREEYFYDGDSDEEDYENSIQKQLRPGMMPLMIYENHAFCKPLFDTKYKDIVLRHLPEENTWEDIAKIVKKESRYERD